MNSDETFLDESNFGRLNLDDCDPVVGRQPSEDALPQPEIFPISPTWGSSLWMLDGSHQILEPKAPCSAGVGNFGIQDPIGSMTDPRGLKESWTVPFPFEASFDVFTSIMHSDANLRVLSPGASLDAEHQHMHLVSKPLHNVQVDRHADTDPVRRPISCNRASPSRSHRKRRASTEEKRADRKRRVFTEEERAKVAAVRRKSACIHCQIKRVKCDVGHPCGPCRKASNVGMCLRGHLSDVVLHKTDILKTVTNTSGNHVTLELHCAPRSLNRYALTPPVQMNIRCRQSSSIPTDFVIPASQLPQTARSLEPLLAKYRKGIWIAMGASQDTLVRCTMLEASRQAKNYPELEQALQIAAISRLVVNGFSITAAESANFWEAPLPHGSITPAPSNLRGQIESILVEKMKQLQVSLLKDLQKKIMSPKCEHQQHLYSVYLTTFVLLYNLEFLYRDQILKVQARQAQQAYPPKATIMMEDWEASATILIAHFRVLCKGKAPFSHAGILRYGDLDADASRYVSALSSLVHATENNLRSYSSGDPGSPLVWISQLLLAPSGS